MSTKTKVSLDWAALNEALRGCGEAEALRLMEAERKGKNRRAHLLRIHARINRLRADRERKELAP